MVCSPKFPLCKTSSQTDVGLKDKHEMCEFCVKWILACVKSLRLGNLMILTQNTDCLQKIG
jgi:hypothetical protein